MKIKINIKWGSSENECAKVISNPVMKCKGMTSVTVRFTQESSKCYASISQNFSRYEH
jgi:hypothetical protein